MAHCPTRKSQSPSAFACGATGASASVLARKRFEFKLLQSAAMPNHLHKSCLGRHVSVSPNPFATKRVRGLRHSSSKCRFLRRASWPSVTLRSKAERSYDVGYADSELTVHRYTILTFEYDRTYDMNCMSQRSRSPDYQENSRYQQGIMNPSRLTAERQEGYETSHGHHVGTRRKAHHRSHASSTGVHKPGITYLPPHDMQHAAAVH